MTWKNDAGKIIKLIFGLAVALSGGFFLWLEMKDGAQHAHTGHVYLLAAWIAIGCIIIAPSVMVGAAKQLVVLIPFDIKVGGKRKTDPPDAESPVPAIVVPPESPGK
jgi:hypothetical protein